MAIAFTNEHRRERDMMLDSVPGDIQNPFTSSRICSTVALRPVRCIHSCNVAGGSFPSVVRYFLTTVRSVNALKLTCQGKRFGNAELSKIDGHPRAISGSHVTRNDSAVVRLKRRITDRLDADRDRPRPYRRTQQGLAEKIGISKATLNELLNGPSSNRGLLAHLDKIADYFGVPPSLLIHRNDTALMELTADEYRVIKHWRTFPPDVQEQVASAFDYFAGLLPEEKAERKIWQRWRRLSPAARARLEDALETAYRAERTSRRATTGSAAAPESTVGNPARVERRPRRTALS